MAQNVRQGSAARRKVVVAPLAGLIVFVLLFAWGGGIDTLPPECFSMFGWYSVPCDGWFAPAAALAAAGVTYLVLWLKDRRGGPSNRAEIEAKLLR